MLLNLISWRSRRTRLFILRFLLSPFSQAPLHSNSSRSRRFCWKNNAARSILRREKSGSRNRTQVDEYWMKRENKGTKSRHQSQRSVPNHEVGRRKRKRNWCEYLAPFLQFLLQAAIALLWVLILNIAAGLRFNLCILLLCSSQQFGYLIFLSWRVIQNGWKQHRRVNATRRYTIY